MGLEGHELSAIDKNFRGNIARCKHEMLICCSRSDKLPTWKAVADALHRMGEDKVASKIQARHCSSSTATGMHLLCLRAENLNNLSAFGIATIS